MQLQLPTLRHAGICRLYLCRHGETDFNVKGFFQGRGVDSTLNPTGHGQASRLAKVCQTLPLDALYCSSLQRSRQTAEHIQQHHQTLDLLSTQDLDEMSFGRLEGKSHADHQAELDRIHGAWREGAYTCGFDAGETPLDVETRGRQAIEIMLTENPQWSHVLAVSHGRFLKIVLASLLGDLDRMHTFEQDNCCVNVLDYDRNTKTFELIVMNNTSFLT